MLRAVHLAWLGTATSRLHMLFILRMHVYGRNESTPTTSGLLGLRPARCFPVVVGRDVVVFFCLFFLSFHPCGLKGVKVRASLLLFPLCRGGGARIGSFRVSFCFVRVSDACEGANLLLHGARYVETFTVCLAITCRLFLRVTAVVLG